MKKLVLAVLLLFAAKAYAQNFEGTIKWSMKMDFTDPKQKAQMEEAQKKMSDPANQAKMKEMQEKMNDPQMKAMMDSNPQMKAQMEKMMSAMQSGDISSMIPKGMTLKIKNQNALTKLEGGAFASEILHLADKDQTYTLDRQNKTYSLLSAPASDKKQATEPVVKVTKTSETTKILNYTCTKYIVEVTENGRTTTQNLWTTTDIKDIDFKAMAKQSAAKGQQRMYFDKVDGVPLRVEVKMPEANMTMEVTDIKRESLSASDFTIPSDFKKI